MSSFKIPKMELHKRWASTPVPHIAGIEGFGTRAIHECGEALVSLNSLAEGNIIASSAYYLKGYKHALKTCYARETVVQLLCQVAELLPSGNRLLIFDCWRPTLLQQELFDQCKDQIQKAHPRYTAEQVIIETRRYVSVPSNNPQSPSPHLTGGAIDLTLCDAAARALEMGTHFDHFGEESKTRYYEEKVEFGEKLSLIEQTSLTNRRILFHAMDHVGFTNYHEEWWHYDYGDQFWATIKQCDAKYGPKQIQGT